MAVDICSEISSPFATPRISLSHDPIREEEEEDMVALDFNFCIIQNLSQPISSADELFANGKILPLKSNKIHSDPIQPRKITAHPAHRPLENPEKKRLIEFLSTNFDADDQEDNNRRFNKPFWKFRRSSSACENGGSSSNGGLLRSLHFLTRSNSTGSAPKHKVMQKQHSMKESSNIRSSPIQYYPYYGSAERPYNLKKSCSSRSYGNNGVRILNIPPTYIAKGTVSFFGIGSFFCSKKSKKKKK
ncbi:hypothetical protein F511_11684 [Dorcoceras hygrometricum]|uniref:Uncharacterized protein n=1 Tax=Dorcoceras hygrometricum TaxID=472368 RepID=A0A2Z7CCK8_9LAMI|nr:hypothetical protein F511_11684 [Dorcoceras hygrometricum]